MTHAHAALRTDFAAQARTAVAARDRLTRATRALRRLRENLADGAPIPAVAEIAALTGLPHPGTDDPAVALDALLAAAEAERAVVNRQLRAARALSALQDGPAAPVAVAAPAPVAAPPLPTLTPAPLLDEAARLGRISASELDGLPFGAILLDATGRVLAYNDTESRMARLPVEAVLGRDFFHEVAPCTRVKDFEGRFRALASGTGPAVATFDFTFPFPFGAQRVSVLLTRGAAAGTVVLALLRR